MSTTETGRAAEAQAAAYLENRGYEILLRNWRTRWHEVDLVARHNDRIHFVEVKYRRTTAYGSGFDYISRDKVVRLIRAAEHWCQINRYGGNYQIDAVAVTGSLSRPIIALLENVTAL